MAILKIRDSNGNVQEILALKGKDADLSDYYTKSETDAAINTAIDGIEIPDVSNYLTEAQVLALIQANMPASAEEVSY